MASLPLSIALSPASLAAFLAVGIPTRALAAALPASRGVFFRGRLRLMVLFLVVVLPLSPPFPLFRIYRTQSAPGRKFSATGTAAGLFLDCGLPCSCRPSEAERLEQIKAVRFVLVPAPMVFADLPA
jgi:hypothetical protein